MVGPLHRWTVLLALGVAGDAEARFAHGDADAIDPEERLGTETYNDKASYRFPFDWERLWRARDVGYRVSAGSLTVNRFDFSEDLKLRAGDDGPMSIAYLQSRREDLVEQTQDRELRLGWRLAGPLRLELLGDGDTFKEYGDIGVAVALRSDRDREVRAYFWSVDHYYATKKSEPDDDRPRQTTSAGVEARWQFGSDVALALAYEADQPLRWRRPSQAHVYDYARQTLHYRAELEGLQGTVGYLSGRHERKVEGKTWEPGAGELAEKTLQRTTHVVEVGAVQRLAAGDLSAAVEVIKRDARYEQREQEGWDSGDDALDVTEGRSPDRSQRREGGLYAAWHFPVVGPRHFLLVGGQLNEVRLDEDGRVATTEVKSQVAWDYRLTDGARALLNTTWDMDQLADDAPYRERPFRPWGGGAIQLLATF